MISLQSLDWPIDFRTRNMDLIIRHGRSINVHKVNCMGENGAIINVLLPNQQYIRIESATQ